MKMLKRGRPKREEKVVKEEEWLSGELVERKEVDGGVVWPVKEAKKEGGGVSPAAGKEAKKAAKETKKAEALAAKESKKAEALAAKEAKKAEKKAAKKDGGGAGVSPAKKEGGGAVVSSSGCIASRRGGEVAANR